MLYLLQGVGWVLLVLMVYEAASQEQENCPALYRRYSAKHTFCAVPLKSCHVLDIGVADRDKEIIIDMHNMLRSRIARAEGGYDMPAAADMMQIEWNDELADVAQKLASLCSVKTDCADCRQVENFAVGQNICNYKVRSKAPPAIYWRSTINFWYEGIKQFPVDFVEQYAYKTLYGTFTQLAWASTWQVGCGYALFTKGSWYVQSYVCNYGPAGNYIGSRMYKPGTACTSCPPGTACINKTRQLDAAVYKGLCKSSSPDGPQVRLPPEAYSFCNFQNASSKDCIVQEQPYGAFQTRRILGGGYLTATASGGESASVTFQRPFVVPSEESFPEASCLRFRFRKGPHGAGTGGQSTLRIRLDVQDSHVVKTTDITRNYPHWATYSISITKPISIQLTLILQVKPKGPPHYLDVTDVLLTKGYC
ncbi:CRISP/Allergen/PR-1-like isoform X2 [Ornithodoros turicata]|uniref:CRISP/Allergen/PR-1-like isoform X2 n=1 Tax=Ornithodoros turicata TaxID=34597 RepID=UPI003139103A